MSADEAVPIWKKTRKSSALGPAALLGFRLARRPGPRPRVLDNPSLVSAARSRFASGSGPIAIAAAKAGAPRSMPPTSTLSPSRRLKLTPPRTGSRSAAARKLIVADEGWAVVLAGDVAYERDSAEAATDWLASARTRRDRPHRRPAPNLSAARPTRLRDRIFRAGDART